MNTHLPQKSIHFLYPALFLLLLACNKETGPKEVIFTPLSIDLGTVEDGETTSTIYIINKTDKDVRILHYMVSCSCVSVKLDTKLIRPKQTAKLEITVHSYGNKPINENVALILSDTSKMRVIKITGNTPTKDIQ